MGNGTRGKLLSSAELARLLGLRRETVLALARDGKIPCYRAGRKTIRFDLGAVLAAMRGDRE